MKKKITIEGMHCEHCADRVRKALLELDEDAKVDINVKKQCAAISSRQELGDAEIRSAISAAGYEVADIKG